MIVTVLLNSLWQGAIIVTIAAIVARFAISASASTRYALWFAALLAFALIPIASSINVLDLFVPPLPYAGVSAPIRAVSGAASNAANWTWLIAAWSIGATFFLARLVWSYVRLSRILHQATPATALGADVVLSHDVTIPIAAGLTAPVVILPATLPSTMEAAELQQIIEHERAHIRRADILTNAAQRAIEALFFFNPFAYLIGAQLLREREVACDDAAVAKTGEPDSYATSLMHLAQSTHRPRTALLSPSAVGSGHALVGRISHILDGRSRAFKLNVALIALGAVTFIGIAVLLASSMRPQIAAPANVNSSAQLQACANQTIAASALNAAPPNMPDGVRLPGPVSSNVAVTLDAAGHPLSARVVGSSGNAAVDQATIAAAMASTYSPQTIDCRAVPGQYLFHAEFAPN